MVAQAHGGALKTGGTPGNVGGRVAAERRRARAERTAEIKDALTGRLETLAAIMGRLIQEADGEQWRCPSAGRLARSAPRLG